MVSAGTPPHSISTDHRLLGIPISEYEPQDGDHLCSVWTDPERDRRAARAFLRDRSGALWVQDPSRDHLQDEDDRAADIAVQSTRDVHLAGGTFDPERMYRFWRERSGEVRTRRMGHLRAVAEMAWALEERPGTEHARSFESGLNAVLAPLPASVICQYGSTRFRPATVLAMLLSHPLVVIGDRVFTNPYYVAEPSFAAESARLGADSVRSLIPIWRYYLHALPTVSEVGAFLCNSLPSFIGSASVTVQLGGETRGWHLDPERDALDEIDLPAVMGRTANRLFAVWPAGTGTLGGSVHTGSHGGVSWVEASCDGYPRCVVLSRWGSLQRSELMLFTTLASAVSSALLNVRALSGFGRERIPHAAFGDSA